VAAQVGIRSLLPRCRKSIDSKKTPKACGGRPSIEPAHGQSEIMAEAGCRGLIDAPETVAGPQLRTLYRHPLAKGRRKNDDPAKKSRGPCSEPMCAGIQVAPGTTAAEEQRLPLDESVDEFQRPEGLELPKRYLMSNEKVAGCFGGKGRTPVAGIGKESQRGFRRLSAERFGKRGEFTHGNGVRSSGSRIHIVRVYYSNRNGLRVSVHTFFGPHDWADMPVECQHGGGMFAAGMPPVKIFSRVA
jgi:hypothetical protein